ncbi:MAG: branched-chain amino acid ABC transporter permease [Candidatus Thorarchaeota archaeon]
MNATQRMQNLPQTLKNVISRTIMDRRYLRRKWWLILILIVLVSYPFLPLPLFDPYAWRFRIIQIGTWEYLLHIVIITNIFAVVAIAYDISGGYTGQENLAIGFFAGMGGYTSAILSMNFGLPIPVSWAIAMGVSFIAALGIGFPALRLKGPYLIIVTFSVAEVARLLTLYFSDITHGEEGLGGIPKLFVGKLANYYWSLFILGAMLVIAWLIIHSYLGLAFRAIAEDEIRAKTLGINVTRYKLISFAICGLIAGFAGAMYAHYQSHIDTHFFSILFTITIISMAVIGGEKTLVGAIVGAYLLQLTSEGLRFVTGPELAWLRPSFNGFLFLIVMLFLPGGIMSIRDRFGKSETEVAFLVCQICGTKYPVPVCCGAEMVIDGGYFACCKGANCEKQPIPEHCGQRMKLSIPD